MKVLYPFNTKLDNLKFGNEPIESFFGKGKFTHLLNNKRVFYVIEPNWSKKDNTLKENQLKIGISHSPAERFRTYYKTF